MGGQPLDPPVVHEKENMMTTPDSTRPVSTFGVATAPKTLRQITLPKGGLVLIYLAVLLWGTAGPAIQFLTTLGPATGQSVGFFRLVLALPILIVACRATGVGLRCRLSPGDLALMLGFGLSLALFQICYFGAVSGIGATVATLISVCLPPLLVTLAATWLRGERVGLVVLAALAVALVGATLTVLDTSTRALGPALLTGGLLAFCAALCAAGGTLIVRSLVERHPPLRVVTIGFTVATLALVGGALPSGMYVHYPAIGWLVLLFLAVVPTALAYVAFLQGMTTTTATAASIAAVFEPLTAALLAFVFFGDRPGPAGLLGALILLGAAVVLTKGSAD
jgi:DME family drug/metabolite transporter